MLTLASDRSSAPYVAGSISRFVLIYFLVEFRQPVALVQPRSICRGDWEGGRANLFIAGIQVELTTTATLRGFRGIFTARTAFVCAGRGVRAVRDWFRVAP